MEREPTSWTIGKVRAKQDLLPDRERKRCMGILLHGDAAFAGQGLVSEILGDHILMFGSDYPHAESRFPGSVKEVDAWDLKPEIRRKLMWDNAARCFLP